MKCDVCGINMYAMTPHFMDKESNILYCENCYTKKLSGRGVIKMKPPLLIELEAISKLKKENPYNKDIDKSEDLIKKLNALADVHIELNKEITATKIELLKLFGKKSR